MVQDPEALLGTGSEPLHRKRLKQYHSTQFSLPLIHDLLSFLVFIDGVAAGKIVGTIQQQLLGIW